MIRLILNLRMLMRMEKITGKYKHIIVGPDYERLLSDIEYHVNELEKLEPVTEV